MRGKGRKRELRVEKEIAVKKCERERRRERKAERLEKRECGEGKNERAKEVKELNRNENLFVVSIINSIDVAKHFSFHIFI